MCIVQETRKYFFFKLFIEKQFQNWVPQYYLHIKNYFDIVFSIFSNKRYPDRP